jgi:putative N-acetyltransferase (TIGR04045 family)
MSSLGQVLLGTTRATGLPGWTIEQATDGATLASYDRLRREVFVAEQGVFAADDRDDVDDDPRRIVLVAKAVDGTVLGGVRLAPVHSDSWSGADLGWWTGSRLVVSAPARTAGGVGPALIRAACAHAESSGVIRFEAAVQPGNEAMFHRLGWRRVRPVTIAAQPHVQMRWPINRFADQARSTKAVLGSLLAGLHLGGAGFVGDDGVPVPGSDLVAACDAIIPSLVERDPEWAGWCSVLVNVNDLAAMGAQPVGLLDAVAARDASFAARIMAGLRRASEAYGVPVLGGHTQLGTPAALSVTALGRTADPIPAGGGQPGHAVSLTADLAGSWRRGHTGRQWDSTTGRSSEQLQRMVSVVRTSRPAAAKDVSMAGLVGTMGMLAEASGCAAVLDVAAIPRPAEVRMGDWLSCFPGFAMLSTDVAGRDMDTAGFLSSRECGQLTAGSGVTLRWPDGDITAGVDSVTGLGAA